VAKEGQGGLRCEERFSASEAAMFPVREAAKKLGISPSKLYQFVERE
jgi:hypothetical protein